MTKAPVEIRPFDVNTASAEELSAAHGLAQRLQAEMWPDDPPRGFEEWIRQLRTVPPFVLLRQWVAWHGGEAVGRAILTASDTPDNRHIADAEIGVAPEWRRQGIAKRFLSHIVQAADALDRKLLLAGTDSALPAGQALMERLGARVGLVSRTNQLDLSQLDPVLMQAWREGGPRDEYELGWWLGPYPEADLAAICNLKDVMNTAPRDNLEVEDWKWTPEMVRQIEVSMLERKIERWTLFTRHRASGELAGYTEVFYDPSVSETLSQGDTGVLSKHRGHGLGRWLKATMIEKVLAERPQVKRVRTGNANSNAPMLRINDAMGFRPYKDWTTWQVEVDKVRDYVARA
jgi:GNAT superfamily N-acetyltransferase